MLVWANSLRRNSNFDELCLADFRKRSCVPAFFSIIYQINSQPLSRLYPDLMAGLINR